MKPDVSKLTALANPVREGVRKHAPTILSFSAVVGLGATVIFAVKATPKATEIIEERNRKLKELEENAGEKTEPKELRKEKLKVHAETAIELAPVVGPAVTTGLFTTLCIIGADRINVGRIANLSAGYDILKDSFIRYKKSNVAEIGEKKEHETELKAAQSRIDDSTLSEEFTINTGYGNIIYFDAITGRYFRSSKQAIERAVNHVNKGITDFMFVSLNEFYYELGVPQVKLGDEFGWNDVPLEVTYNYTETPSGEHAIVIDYDISLRHRFGDY